MLLLTGAGEQFEGLLSSAVLNVLSSLITTEGKDA